MSPVETEVVTQETKPGFLTTEFWVTIITGLYLFANASGILEQVPNRWSALGMAFISGLYAVARGQAKQGVGYTTTRSVRR